VTSRRNSACSGCASAGQALCDPARVSTDPIYAIVFQPRAARQFRRLPRQAQQRLSGVIDQLALDPGLGFPDRFGSIQDARVFARTFFTYYNTEHCHSGIGLLTPADVHYDRAEQVHAARQDTLDRAYAAHPRTVRPQAPTAAGPARTSLDQPTTTSRTVRPTHSVNLSQIRSHIA
jgi:hypothetical protein